MRMILLRAFLLTSIASTLACSVEVGSQKWCDNIKGKPEGDWTLNEAKAYAKHCLFR